MSEQAKILAELQEIIMQILGSGSATEDQGKRIDELEDLLHQQKCYQEIDRDEYEYLGEEIAGLFANELYMEAIEKMCKNQITPEDFFGFIGYHDEDEEFSDLFTNAFIDNVNRDYLVKCKSEN